MTIKPEEFFKELEAEGEESVRTKSIMGAYGERKAALVGLWLSGKEKQRQDNVLKEQEKVNKSIQFATWVMTVATVVMTITAILQLSKC